MKKLFIVTSVIESVTGLAFIISPSLLIDILLGSSVDGQAGMLLCRVAGLALLSIGIACWFARNDANSQAAKGLLVAILFYNSAVALLLAYAAIEYHLAGVGLWPVVLFHAVMALWSASHLFSKQGRKINALT